MTKSWLLDGEPVTEAEIFEAAEKYFPFMEMTITFLRQNGHDVSPIPEEQQTAECPWPERVPKT